MTRPFTAAVVFTVSILLLAADARAQFLGTFTWQLQPFCNVVTVAITQNGAVYRLEGTDDQCGSGVDAASVTGTAPAPLAAAHPAPPQLLAFVMAMLEREPQRRPDLREVIDFFTQCLHAQSGLRDSGKCYARVVCHPPASCCVSRAPPTPLSSSRRAP